MESPTREIEGDGQDSVVYVDESGRKYHYANGEGVPICGVAKRKWGIRTEWVSIGEMAGRDVIKKEEFELDIIKTKEKDVGGKELCQNCRKRSNSERSQKEAYRKLVDVAGITREGSEAGLTKMQMEELIRKLEK